MNRHVYYIKRMQTIYAIGSRYLDFNTLHTQAMSLSILNYILKCEHNLWKLNLLSILIHDSLQLIITYVPSMPPPLGYATVLFISILYIIIFVCMYVSNVTYLS